MQKSANINVRLEPELKEQAESILNQLGIPISNAINIFLKQVVMKRGIPFDISLNDAPISIPKVTEKKMDLELMKGYYDYKNCRLKPAKQVFDEIKKGL